MRRIPPTRPSRRIRPIRPIRPLRPAPIRAGTGPFGFARLSFFGDCDALLTYMQTEARERVTAWGLDGGYYYGP